MNFLERIARGAEYRNLANPPEWLREAFSVTASFSGKKVTQRGSLSLSYVWSAVTLISEQMSLLPLKVYKSLEDDRREEAHEHRAWRMLHDKPNPYTPAGRFWSTACGHLLLHGNVLIEMLRNEFGLVEELWLLDPTITNVEWDENLRQKRFYQDSTGGRKFWTTDSVLHIFGFSADGIVGLSPIAECRQAIGTAIARDEFEGGFYKRGAVHSGVLETEKKLSGNAYDNLRESWKARFGRGSTTAHDVPILEEGLTFRPLTQSLKDLEFVASKQLTATEVANIFNMPASFLGGSTGDSLTYDTVEGNKIQLAQTAVAPRALTLSSALSQSPQIFPQNRAFHCEFVLEGMLRGDAKSRAEFYEIMHRIKAIKVNEIRARENLEPVPWGEDEPSKAAPEPSEQPALPPGEVPPALEASARAAAEAAE